LNRLEHAPQAEPSRYHKIGHDGEAIARTFVELFLDAHRRPPKQIVLDLDATDDPLHGYQEGRFFHGYYDCYCYPRRTDAKRASVCKGLLNSCRRDDDLGESKGKELRFLDRTLVGRGKPLCRYWPQARAAAPDGT